jgi:hypothetical protein
LQQALLDLSTWVEKGIAPTPSTSYKIVDGQVVVPPTAEERKGIQPVVTVKANGGKRAEVKVGQPVTFTAQVEVPKNMGKVVVAAWHFEGEPDDISKRAGWSFETSGTFPIKGEITPSDKTGSRVALKTTYTFSKKGTYFPTLRVASQREGDARTTFTRIQNLDRVRVVVK